MSLILDALRRADSERERGAVPGLHAQPVPAASPELPASERRTPWLWLLAAAGAGLIAALAWVLVGRETARPSATTAAAAPPAVSAPAVPPPVAADGQRAVPPPGPAPQASVASTAAPAPRADTGEPQPVAEPAPWPSPASDRKAAAPESSAAARTSAAAPLPPPVAAAPEAPLARREQLPENIRSQLPPLAIGGSIYSANPSDRSVIIDGRLLRENDRLGADLALEQIRPKSAVLQFKGYRFEIAF